MDDSRLSLYLHIPFCAEKCDYCDFYSISPERSGGTNSARPDSAAEAGRFKNRYLDALLAETERRFREAANELPAALKGEGGAAIVVPSIYIGGGTPSIFGAEGITRLLRGIKPLASESCEITVEANPETADSAFLSACALNGVTRLSLGIQSFDEALLQAVGRKGCNSGCGNAAGSKAARGGKFDKVLTEAAERFGKGLSLDLMSGLPGQSETTLRSGIEKALSYEPGHISLYALTVEEGTPLAKRFRQNTNPEDTGTSCKLPGEEHAEALWIAGRDTLQNAGYDHYEVSNFARVPEARSLHNIRYWRMKNWLGVGPAASGTIIGNKGSGRRQSYVPDVEQFCSAVEKGIAPPLIVEELDPLTVLKETLLMGYRYCEGPDEELFVRRFGKTIEETIPQTLKRWRNRQDDAYGTRTKRAKLSVHGTIMNYLNRFLLDAFEELDAAYKT